MSDHLVFFGEERGGALSFVVLSLMCVVLLTTELASLMHLRKCSSSQPIAPSRRACLSIDREAGAISFAAAAAVLGQAGSSFLAQLSGAPSIASVLVLGGFLVVYGVFCCCCGLGWGLLIGSSAPPGWSRGAARLCAAVARALALGEERSPGRPEGYATRLARRVA